MSRSNNPSEESKYLAWYKSVNLYVATTHCLLGMSEKDFDERYPCLKWVWHGIMKSDLARSLAAINSLRCRAVLADSVTELQEINERAISVCRDFTLQPWEDPFMENMAIEVCRHRLLRGLHCVVNYFFGDALKFYPPILSSKSIRLLLVGYSDICSSKAVCEAVRSGQDVMPGCFNTTCIAGVSRVTKDNNLLELLYSVEGKGGTWWSAVINGWRCYFSPGSELLIDGENVASSDFEVFIRLQSFRLKNINSRITLFKSTEDQMWKHAIKKSGLRIRYQEVTRLLHNKSLVDFELMNEVSRGYYERGCRKFYIMSSDSDFSVLCTSFPDAEFVFICRRSTTSEEWVAQMNKCGICVHWMDESCRIWNQGIFATNFICNKATEVSYCVCETEEQWCKFLAGLGFSENVSAVKVAKQRLIALYRQKKEVVV